MKTHISGNYIDRPNMKQSLLLGLLLSLALPLSAQKKNLSYSFYGQVRGDLYLDSRASQEIVDGLFFLYPKDHAYDADGKDLNASPTGSFYLLYSRLGLDVQGPTIGQAKSSLKLEVDFRGYGSNWALLRIRHAYANLDWGKSAVLIGQTWHSLFGEVSPQMLNLSTGAPFQPFNRSPQVRYRYQNRGWQLTATALWQLQYLSAGPNGKSEEYIKNSCIPEFYFGVDRKGNGWQVGAGVDVLSIVPRTQNVVEEKTYKVSERVTGVSGELHAKYQNKDWFIAAKTLYATNLAHTCMLGGYGVTAIDPRTGEQDYAPYHHATAWLNVVYGKKWKPGFFVGYLKNLGANTPIVGATYGTGLDVDQLFTTNWQLSYNLPHWRLGVEYTPSIAWFGTVDKADGGRIRSDHHVTNHRAVVTMSYQF